MSNWSLFCHNYNTVPGGIQVNVQGYAITGVEFDGYHTGRGMIATNADGSLLLWNFKGWGFQYMIPDDGSPWIISGNMGAYTTDAHPFNQFHYDSVADRWWGLVYQESAVAGRLHYSDDDCATWNYFVGAANGYAHGFCVDADDNVYMGYYLGAPNKIREYYEFPATGYNEDTSDGYYNVSASNWEIIDWNGGDEVLHLISAQGTDYVHAKSVRKSDLAVVYNYSDDMGFIRNFATNDDDIALFQNQESGLTITYNVVTPQTESTYPIGQLPTTNITFPEVVTRSNIAYDAGKDRFYIIGIQSADRTVAYIKYADASNVYEWKDIRTVTLPWPCDADPDRQFYWSHDDEFYFTYMRLVDSIKYCCLAKIVIGEAQAAETGTVIHQSNFDVENPPPNEFPCQVGPVLTTTTTSFISADAEYGAGALDTADNMSNALNTATGIALNPNRCTIELSYKPDDFAAYAGLFFFGLLGQNAERLQLGVNTSGKLVGLYNNNFSTHVQAVSATALTVGVYNKVCLEMDGMYLRVYLAGIEEAKSPYAYTSWGGSDHVRVGLARNSGASVWHRGPIDNYRVTNGAAIYKGNYTPATGPF